MFRKLISYTVILGAFLTGCTQTHQIINSNPDDVSANVEYSVIYYIHGDADYLFHNSDGSRVRADEQVLARAIDVAKEAASGEVFIFHQLPQRRFLGLFPKKSVLLYYRNGKMVSRVLYSDKNEPFLIRETQLYNEYEVNSVANNQPKYFLFFGHEIPEHGGNNYSMTLPDIPVNTESFTYGLQHFLSNNNDTFNLVVLSSCNNGTPSMVKHLLPYTDVLLASPQNLHLSYIDSDSLELLENNPGMSSLKIADAMADQTFNRLVKSIQTTITLSVYDFDMVRKYINELDSLDVQHEVLKHPNVFSDNVDCNQIPLFDAEKYSTGVQKWYQPAKFGRKAATTNIPSGWGCK